MNEQMGAASNRTETSTDDIKDYNQCLAYIGDYECDGDVAGLYNGLPLCRHHLDKTDIYDYPRIR
jgi:hypothetical protein